MKKLILFLLLFFISSTAHAKDLYVAASGGSDSTTYANNDISHPWATVAKGITSPLPGDTVYFRGGPYSVTNYIDTRDITPRPASEGERITYRGYPGETAIINCTYTASSSIRGGVYGVINIDNDYITISNLTINQVGLANCIVLGGLDYARNFIFENNVCTFDSFGGGENIAMIHDHIGSLTTGMIVRNNTITGPGATGNWNTSCIFLFRSRGTKIYNNDFSACPTTLYYKHTGLGSQTGIEVYNNYLHNSEFGILWVGQYASIRNNIITGGLQLGVGGGLGDDGQNNGGDHNTFDHNTFISPTSENLTLVYTGDGDGSGCQANAFTNNIFYGSRLYAHPYVTTPDDNSTFSYNMFNSSSVAMYKLHTDYTLTQIRSLFDANAVAGTPTFVGGATPSTIAGYALTSGSIGYNAGSGGDSMGAEVSLVGPEVIIVEYDDPIVEILTASGQTTTATVFEITGTATADTGLTIAGVACHGQTVTADDGTWDELSESWTCQAALSVGVNNLTFTGTDSISNTGTDSVEVTRTPPPSSGNVIYTGSMSGGTYR